MDDRKKLWHIYMYIIYVYIKWILFSHKKEQHLDICDNIDGPHGQYAK